MLMLIIVFIVFVFPLILFVIAVWMYKSNKEIIRVLSIVPVLLVFFFVYLVYDAIYPYESFYIKEWEVNTVLPFPKSAKFKWKDATYPDQHNDYTSTAIIVVSQSDFNSYYLLATKNESIEDESECILSQYLPSDFQRKELIKNCFYYSSISSFRLAFGKDNKTIVFQSHSS